ncbi:hypothetical protein CDL15_Pgr012095 [Punica granatum]|uniref:Uncharacterized protein n=1 Tax=Punica granatum TaxID=22663 RepID=A0A218XKT0_PUNGR|nr:hypothetical protein CDL15_Pgr012095 [Punica granatum]
MPSQTHCHQSLDHHGTTASSYWPSAALHSSTAAQNRNQDEVLGGENRGMNRGEESSRLV